MPRRRKKLRESGFVCPGCLVPTQVVCTRVLGSELIRRYRECPSCKWSVVTDERGRATLPPSAGSTGTPAA